MAVLKLQDLVKRAGMKRKAVSAQCSNYSIMHMTNEKEHLRTLSSQLVRKRVLRCRIYIWSKKNISNSKIKKALFLESIYQ